MVSGKVPKLSAYQLLKMLGDVKQGQLGRTYVNFGQPLNLKDYLINKIHKPVVNYENIDEVSLSLSETLYKE